MPQSTPNPVHVAGDGSAITEPTGPRLAVTTARRAKGQAERAEAVAAHLGATLVERQSFSAGAVLAKAGAEVLYVVGADREWIQDKDGQRCFVHEGRFSERAKRLPRVPLLRAVGEADCVIDGTCGLGQDALLMASAVKRVIAYEASPVVFCLLTAGFARLRTREDAVGHAARRVEIRQGEIAAELSCWALDQPAVLLLDPMWNRSHPGADHMAMLGQVAHRQPFDADTLDGLAAAVPRMVMKVPPGERDEHPRWTQRIQSTRAAYLVAERA